jgi:hypothetical protein
MQIARAPCRGHRSQAGGRERRRHEARGVL